jgi:hypothetical protein
MNILKAIQLKQCSIPLPTCICADGFQNCKMASFGKYKLAANKEESKARGKEKTQN